MLKRNVTRLSASFALCLACAAPAAAQVPGGDDDGIVRTFAILPEVVEQDPNNAGQVLQLGHPEGLTVDSTGYVYVATFDAGYQNYIYVYDPAGRLDARVTIPMDGLPLGRAPLGMAADRNYLYVNEVLNGDILRYTLPVTSNSVPERVYDICGGFIVAFGLGAPGAEFCALNANDIGPDGRLYMSDNGAGPSFVFSEDYRNGRLFVLDPVTGASSVWFDGDRRRELDVAIAAHPEFGVNGIAFNNEGTEVFMANMSTDFIYRMPVTNCGTGCQPTALREFVRGQGINGPDNIDFDENGILWVASGQNDRVVGINRAGRVIAKIGAFEGFSRSGAPEGLLQPSGIAAFGGRIYVGNESSRGLRPTPDLIPESEWEQLRLFTVSVVFPWIYGLGQ
jgi:sugar lactone lactonase YvrE